MRNAMERQEMDRNQRRATEQAKGYSILRRHAQRIVDAQGIFHGRTERIKVTIFFAFCYTLLACIAAYGLNDPWYILFGFACGVIAPQILDCIARLFNWLMDL